MYIKFININNINQKEKYHHMKRINNKYGQYQGSISRSRESVMIKDQNRNPLIGVQNQFQE